MLKKIYKKQLATAKKHVIFVTPYFIPKRWFIKALRGAVARGIEVEVLVPRHTNHFLADKVAYFFMFKLSKLGIKFFLMPQMNHAKAMMMDSVEGILGTHNLDFFSFELNAEVGIYFKDSSSVQKLSEIINKWKKESTLFDFRAYKPKWSDYVFSPIIRLFSSIL